VRRASAGERALGPLKERGVRVRVSVDPASGGGGGRRSVCECERAKVEWGSATELTEPGSAPSNSAVLGGRVEDWPLGLGVCRGRPPHAQSESNLKEKSTEGGRTEARARSRSLSHWSDLCGRGWWIYNAAILASGGKKSGVGRVDR